MLDPRAALYAASIRPRRALDRLAIVALALFCLLGSAVGARAQDRKRLLHAKLVIVNGVDITRGDIEGMMEFLFEQRFPGRPFQTVTEEELEELQGSALNELIVMHLIYDEVLQFEKLPDEEKAKQMRLEPSTQEISERMDRMGMQAYRADRLVRDYARSRLISERILANLGDNVLTIRPKDVRRLYKKYRDELFVTNRHIKVRHFFLPALTGDEESTRRKIQSVREMMVGRPVSEMPEFFGRQAQNLSEGPFAPIGGQIRLGREGEWIVQGRVYSDAKGNSPFPEAVWHQLGKLREPGTLTPVFQSDRGFHLLYLEGVRGGQSIPWSEAEKIATRSLEESHRSELLADWMSKKIKTANIVYHTGEAFPKEDIIPPVVPPEEFIKQKVEALRQRDGAFSAAP